MKLKEVLIIGAGIAGCSAALALAKKGIHVTIATSPLDERLYHAPFIQHEEFEIKLLEIQKGVDEQVSCFRAAEQLTTLARKSVGELLESHYLIDRNGNVDIHRCLQDQLKQHPNVDWLSNHTLIELLTLHQHSARLADAYKPATCVGALLYNHDLDVPERFLAKEVILATGGAASLYPYSTHPRMSRGEGIALARKAGARVIHLDQIQFEPITLFQRGRPGFPLPQELLKMGGQLYVSQNNPSELIEPQLHLTEQLYDLMVGHQTDHLWLNLTMLDHTEFKEKYPNIDAYCLDQGFNISKDPLPIAPMARYTIGGIAVDRVGQTTVQRLRVIGEAGCTGLVYERQDESLTVLEGLTWAITCAEDISKHIGKFIYYFPDLKPLSLSMGAGKNAVLEDWSLLKGTMWNYVGIRKNRSKLARGLAILNELKKMNESKPDDFVSIDQIHLNSSLDMALLIARSALERASFESSGGPLLE